MKLCCRNLRAVPKPQTRPSRTCLVISLNNLARWVRLRKPLDYDRVARAIMKWKSYGRLIYFHLLLNGLSRAGLLDQKPKLARQGYRR